MSGSVNVFVQSLSFSFRLPSTSMVRMHHVLLEILAVVTLGHRVTFPVWGLGSVKLV